MVKTISVKELRMNFPKIKKDLDNGVRFKIIYRSKPLADLTPANSSSSERIYDLPKDMLDYLENIEKYAFHAKEPFDAAEEISKDREET